MRSRNTDNTSSSNSNLLVNGNYNSGPYLGSKTVETESFTGHDIPHFHKRKREGELLPFTKYDHSKHYGYLSGDSNVTSSSGTNYSYSNGFADELSLTWMITDAEIESIVSSNVDLDRLLSICASKIYSKGHDTLTFLAELDKIIKMFANVRKRLFQLLKGDLNPLDAWLEYRYGWRVLYYDLVDINKAISNLDDSRKRFSDRVGFTQSITDHTSYPLTYGVNNQNVTIDTTFTVSARGSIVADISPPNFRLNPVLTTWELITFSFIIDWFVDVGSWLESLSFLTLASSYYGAVGYKVTASRVTENHTQFLSQGATGPGTHISSTYDCTLIHRVPSSVPHYPHFSIQLDLAKLVDVAAIIRTASQGGLGGGKRI